MSKCLRGGIEYKRHRFVTKYGETKCGACGQVKMSTCEQEFLKAIDAPQSEDDPKMKKLLDSLFVEEPRNE
jgi:hypothetical protein